MSTLNLTPEPDQAPIAFDNSELIEQAQSGANWFYWIAGLSLVNIIIGLFGTQVAFIAGLGVSLVLSAIGQQIGSTLITVIALAMNLVIAGALVLLGLWANKRHVWPFAVGLVLYSFDTLIMLALGMYIGAIFPGYVIYRVFRGLMATRQLNATPVV